MKYYLFIFILLAAIPSMAQYDLSLYNMRHIPQVVNTNPAIMPLGRLNISIPFLGSIYGQLGKSDFDVDVTSVDDQGTLRVDVDKFINGLSDENLVYAGTSVEDLHVGFTAGKNYIFITATDKVSAQFQFPKEAAIFITEVFDQVGIPGYTNIPDLKLNGSHHREIGLGWSRKLNEKWSAGARVKVLSGISSIKTNTSGIVIDGVSGDDLTGLVNVDVQTSGIEEYVKDPLLTLSGFQNWGYSLDFGVEFKPMPKIKVAASVIDLMGTIKWTENVKNYQADSVRVDFNTVGWGNIFNPNGEGTGFSDFIDSIVSNTEPALVNAPYTTQVPTKILGSFTYYITPKIEATLVGQGAFTSDYFQPYLRIGIQGRFKRFLNYMVSYSIIDDQVSSTNLGVGLAVNIGPVQIHALTDNIFDPFLFTSDFNPSLRFGINLTFGRDNE